MIKAASTENLSTVSARYAEPDGGSFGSEMARRYLETRKPKTSENKTGERKGSADSVDLKGRSGTPDRFSAVTESENNPLYYKTPPTAPVDDTNQRPVVIGHSHYQVPCPKYDVSDVERWIQLYEHVAIANSWDEKEKFNRLFQAFDNTPYIDYYINLTSTRKIYDWDSAKRVFLYRQSDPRSLINAEAIYQRKQGSEEKVADYIIKKETLFCKIRPSLPEEFIVSQIAQGLKPEIYDKLMTASLETPIKTVDDLLNKGTSIEKLINSIANRTDSKGKRPVKHVEFENDGLASRPRSPVSQESDKFDPTIKNIIRNEMRDLKRSLNEWHMRQERFIRNQNRPNPGRFTPNRFQNSFPNRFREPNRDNPQREEQTTPKSTPNDTNVTRNTEGKVLCYNCNKYGHFSRECPSPRKPFRGKPQNPKPGN